MSEVMRLTIENCMARIPGLVHRFEDFSDDLAVWVVFHGPERGEVRGDPS